MTKTLLTLIQLNHAYTMQKAPLVPPSDNFTRAEERCCLVGTLATTTGAVSGIAAAHAHCPTYLPAWLACILSIAPVATGALFAEESCRRLRLRRQ